MLFRGLAWIPQLCLAGDVTGRTSPDVHQCWLLPLLKYYCGGVGGGGGGVP